MARYSVPKITLSIPWVGKVKITRTEEAKRAAWELYVELQTRIAVQPLENDQGLLRESLNSLHSLFGTTRDVLRRAGPAVGASPESVGGIAIRVLNDGLRPFLTRWHPQLLAWEANRDHHMGSAEHEASWKYSKRARRELEALRKRLARYARGLARISGAK